MNEAFKIGGTSLAVSGGIVAVGYYIIRSQQAQYPGEKDFGVGILMALFGVPAVLLMLIGCISLLVGVVFALRTRCKQN